MSRDWSRRRFLQTALLAAAAGRVPVARAAPVSHPSIAPAITGDAAIDRTVIAAVEALLPDAGRGPSARDAAVTTHLAGVAADPAFAGVRGLWRRGGAALDRLAGAEHGIAFTGLDGNAQLALLDRALRGEASEQSALLAPFALALLEFSLEGYFGHPRHGGNRDALVWRRYGLDDALGDEHAAHHAPPVAARTPAADAERAVAGRWDVIVVGSGAGGAALAWRLASRGARVLVLEKGDRVGTAQAHDEIASTRRNLFVPYARDEPHLVSSLGAAPQRRHDGWTACCVGGGTVHMSAMLLRMQPADFTANGGGAAWPFGYRALQPYYDAIERTLGVSGDRAANPFEPPAPPLPLPPIPAHPAAARLAAAMRAAELHPYPLPRGILTRPHGGRAACVQCPFCAGYACQVEAKAGADVTLLRMAEATGNALVAAGMRVTAVRAAGRRAEGVAAIDPLGVPRRLDAAVVVLAAGAIESARLALLSTSPSSPRGLGNADGQVGRHLSGSYNAGLQGRFEFPGNVFAAADDAPPFLNVAAQDLYAGPRRRPGGGTVVIERRPPSPIAAALTVAFDPLEHGRPLLGAPLKDRLFAELAQSRAVAVESFLPMHPHPEQRVTLAADTADAWGLPAAHIHYARALGDAGRGAAVVELGERVLRTAGAADCGYPVALEETPFLLAGTLRMGPPASAACDAQGRLHGLDNVYVCDAGALPGIGGVPPTLTIMANALRIADAIRPA